MPYEGLRALECPDEVSEHSQTRMPVENYRHTNDVGQALIRR
jgi:hypothetical protein